MTHRSIGLLCASLLAFAAAGRAHEIGTTRVTAEVHDNRYQVEIVTDATALAEKLQTVSGKPPSTITTDAKRLKGAFENWEPLFRQRVTLSFDGAPVTPAIAFEVDPAIDATSAIAAKIHLSGDVPSGAKHLTFLFGWTFATYSISVRDGNGNATATQWVEGNQMSPPVDFTASAPVPSQLTTAARYLTLGFTHIVPYGFDHVLFVLGIYLLSRRARSIFVQVSAFTIAHSITLGLSMFGVISVSSRIVEPAIAISIAYVAIENLFLSELRNWRVALVFSFGLLHGLGFAGALREVGLPRSQFVTALLTFNLGVEAGQLAVIGAAFLLVGWTCANQTWYRSRVVIPASLVIACTAVYWTVQRIIA